MSSRACCRLCIKILLVVSRYYSNCWFWDPTWFGPGVSEILLNPIHQNLQQRPFSGYLCFLQLVTRVWAVSVVGAPSGPLRRGMRGWSFRGPGHPEASSNLDKSHHWFSSDHNVRILWCEEELEGIFSAALVALGCSALLEVSAAPFLSRS